VLEPGKQIPNAPSIYYAKDEDRMLEILIINGDFAANIKVTHAKPSDCLKQKTLENLISVSFIGSPQFYSYANNKNEYLAHFSIDDETTARIIKTFDESPQMIIHMVFSEISKGLFSGLADSAAGSRMQSLSSFNLLSQAFLQSTVSIEMDIRRDAESNMSKGAASRSIFIREDD
jgi:hypothetical protein